MFNWSAPCLEQGLIRWEGVVDDNFRVNKTENEFKAVLIRGWIGDKGTQYLHQYTWTGDEWQNNEMIMERFKEKIQPKVGTKEINISLIQIILGKQQRVSVSSGLS